MKNNLEDALNSATESIVDFPKHLKIIDINNNQNGGGYSETSSENQNGGGYSATSAYSNQQLGGNYSATSAYSKQRGGNVYSETSSAIDALKNMTFSATSSYRNSNAIQAGGNNVTTQNNEYDVNKLLAMLTTESSNIQDSEKTSVIENKLREALSGQAGGAQVLPSILASIDQSLLNFTETEYNISDDYQAYANIGLEQAGGAMSEGFKAFLEFKKFIANKFKIPNGIQATKIASAVLDDVKNLKGYSGLDKNQLYNKAKKYLETKMDDYKKLIA